MKFGFFGVFWPLRYLCRFSIFKDDFGRFLGTVIFLDTASGHRIMNFIWKLCTLIYNFLFCCFTLMDLQFRVTLQQNQQFREVHQWSELYSFYVLNMHILPFKNAFGCFKHAVSYLSRSCFFFGAVWLFKGWFGLFCLCLPGNPGYEWVHADRT